MADSKKYTTVVTHSSELFDKLAQDRGVDVFVSLLETPASANDLATKLGMARAKVNYLLDCMLQEDLVYLHSEKRNGSAIEAYYAVRMETFHRCVGYESSESQQVKSLLYTLDVMKENIIQIIRTKESTHLGMVHAKVRKERVQEYIRRLKQLQEEFDQENADAEADNEWYSMALSVFPNPGFK